MERPGLRRLMADIEDGKIDIVVVYKIDRLTRSLPDFARLVEVFDRHGVSFVSVTQQFNTTTSMGRLTLNILLSFAQFEREVTGERIRDKIAASKAKGMWMGGVPPLGYDVKDRKLVVNDREAALVREIFTRYAEHGSAARLVRELQVEGHTTKSWETQTGKFHHGRIIDQQYLSAYCATVCTWVRSRTRARSSETNTSPSSRRRNGRRSTPSLRNASAARPVTGTTRRRRCWRDSSMPPTASACCRPTRRRKTASVITTTSPIWKSDRPPVHHASPASAAWDRCQPLKSSRLC